MEQPKKVSRVKIAKTLEPEIAKILVDRAQEALSIQSEFKWWFILLESLGLAYFAALDFTAKSSQ